MHVMRTSPLVGRKAWFGPRRVGWGLEPVSTEGWLVTVAFAALAFLVRRTKLNSRWVRYGMAAGFLLFALLKGSAPGGAGARVDFEAAHAAPVTK
jgi:hypothetical protein